MANLLTEYPQLNGSDKSVPYSLIKSVKNGQFDFEIQLYSQPEGVAERQDIIVFKNVAGECFPLPFFSNKYTNYWGFPSDKEIPDIERPKTSINLELNNALNKMTAKSNNSDLKNHIINDLLTSVLNCELLEEKDSLLIYNTFFLNSDIPNEDHGTASLRLRKNYDLMKQQWHPGKYVSNYNCYLDRRNYRIYQINYELDKIDIKVFRQDLGFTPFNY